MWHFTSFSLSFTPRVGWTWKWHNQRTWLPSCNNLSGGYSLGVNKPWGFSMRQNNQQLLWNANWRERTFYSNNHFAGVFFMLVCSVLIVIFPFSLVWNCPAGLLDWLKRTNKKKSVIVISVSERLEIDSFSLFLLSLLPTCFILQKPAHSSQENSGLFGRTSVSQFTAQQEHSNQIFFFSQKDCMSKAHWSSVEYLTEVTFYFTKVYK